MGVLRTWVFAMAVLVFVATAFAQMASPEPPVSPGELIQAVVANELNRRVD